MNFLEERIVKDGIVKAGNVLKVDSFLNHQMDVALLDEIGRVSARIRQVQQLFDLSTDDGMIDSCIYELHALHARMGYLLRRAREDGVVCPVERMLDYERV